MEEVIEKILEIEEKAREIVSDAENEKSGLEEEIKELSEKLRRDISSRAEEKSNALREYEDGEADRKIEAINAEAQRSMQLLEEKFAQNRDKWVEEIFSSVTG